MSDGPVFNFAHYEPGKHYGAREFAVDDATVAKWRSVYPNDDDSGVMPAGMLAMIVIDAVLTLNSPRPPGGVHGGQTFDTLAEMDALDVLLLDSETVLVAGVDGVLTRLDADGSQSLSEAPGLVNVDRAALGYVGVGPEGQVWTSTDGDARTWTTRGRLDGMPAALETGEDRWYAATSTGIHASDDQGVSWEKVS